MKRTGKYAYVDGIPCTQGWGTNRVSSVARYFASCVPGASGATAGNTNETGSVNGLGYLPPIPDGNTIPFVGVASAKTGEILNYEGDILITDTTLNIPVGAGGQINWSANFGVQGELTKDTATAYEDDSTSVPVSAKDAKVAIEQLIGTNTFADVERPQNIALTFRRPASETINNGTTEREGGNLEVDLSIEVHNDDLDVPLYDLNQANRVRVYVTPTLFYMIDSIIWNAHNNYRVDRSTNPPPIIGYTVNGMFTAKRERTPPALGQILLPGGATLYPETP